jgi:hypothetical protein
MGLLGDDLMAKKVLHFMLLAFLCVYLFTTQSEKSYAGSAEELTPEKLIAAHVKAIGNPKLLEKVQSKTFIGTSDAEFVQGMNGSLKGTALIVSQGPKLGIIFKYKDINYPGEYFAFDGKDVTVGYISPGQKSPIADFIFRFNGIMKEGMLGGILSTSWPLLDIQKKQVTLKCRKTKIDGQERYELEYHPKEGFGNMKVRMYFDPISFNHVRTDYVVRIKEDATVGNTGFIDQFADKDTQKANNPQGKMAIGQVRDDSIYTLTEKFEDFKKIGGMTLPYKYTIEYSLDGNGHPFVGHWTSTASNWAFNAANLNDKIFQAQK